MNTNKKTVGAAIGVTAAITAATFLSETPTKQIVGKWSVTTHNPYYATMKIEVPYEFTPDIVVLKLNDMEVDKALLPHEEIETLPIVFSNAENLSLDMQVRGEVAATAVFNEDGTLNISVNKAYIKERTEDEK